MREPRQAFVRRSIALPGASECAHRIEADKRSAARRRTFRRRSAVARDGSRTPAGRRPADPSTPRSPPRRGSMDRPGRPSSTRPGTGTIEHAGDPFREPSRPSEVAGAVSSGRRERCEPDIRWRAGASITRVHACPDRPRDSVLERGPRRLVQARDHGRLLDAQPLEPALKALGQDRFELPDEPGSLGQHGLTCVVELRERPAGHSPQSLRCRAPMRSAPLRNRRRTLMRAGRDADLPWGWMADGSSVPPLPTMGEASRLDPRDLHVRGVVVHGPHRRPSPCRTPSS